MGVTTCPHNGQARRRAQQGRAGLNEQQQQQSCGCSVAGRGRAATSFARLQTISDGRGCPRPAVHELLLLLLLREEQ
jgi:hypothetical protein